MCSSPVRAWKLPIAVEQLATGGCWNTARSDTPLQKAKWDGRKGTIMIKSNPTPIGWVTCKLDNNNTNTETQPIDAFTPQTLTEQVQGQHCAGCWEETASTRREKHSLERQTCEHEQAELSFRENKVLWELKGRSKQLPSLRSKDNPSVSVENRSQTCSTTTFTWSVLVMAQALRRFHPQWKKGKLYLSSSHPAPLC